MNLELDEAILNLVQRKFDVNRANHKLAKIANMLELYEFFNGSGLDLPPGSLGGHGLRPCWLSPLAVEFLLAPIYVWFKIGYRNVGV